MKIGKKTIIVGIIGVGIIISVLYYFGTIENRGTYLPEHSEQYRRAISYGAIQGVGIETMEGAPCVKIYDNEGELHLWTSCCTCPPGYRDWSFDSIVTLDNQFVIDEHPTWVMDPTLTWAYEQYLIALWGELPPDGTGYYIYINSYLDYIRIYHYNIYNDECARLEYLGFYLGGEPIDSFELYEIS